MRIEPLLRRVDRLAGGRHRDVRVPGAREQDARRALWGVCAILVVGALLGAATVIGAAVLVLAGGGVPLLVWLRCLVLFAISVSLFYFLWRAALGWYWAYQRLLLFSRVFPVIAVVLALIPGIFPWWVIAEQIALAALLIAAQFVLSSTPVTQAFPRPPRRQSRTDISRMR